MKFTDHLVTKSSSIMMGLLLLTIFFSSFAIHLKMDKEGLSYNNVDSKSFKAYQTFNKTFGNDDYVFFAVKSSYPVYDLKVREVLPKIRVILEADKRIKKVVDVTDFNSEKLLSLLNIKQFWDHENLLKIESIIPGMKGLLSDDFKTIAFAVDFQDSNINGFAFSRQVDDITALLESGLPGETECHAIGFPVLRAAFERYNLINSSIYVLIGSMVGTLAALYIFKNLYVTLIVTLSSGIATIWTAGLMVLTGTSLSFMSGVSICFIIIVSTTTVMHIVSKYYELAPNCNDTTECLTGVLSIVLTPCFMCALTTSIGFASMMVSPIKMIHNAGIMLSAGVICAFIVALVVSVFFLKRMKPPKKIVHEKIQNDLMSMFLATTLIWGLKKPSQSIWTGLILVVVFFLGSMFIQTSKSPVFPVSANTKEARSMDFFAENLLTGYHISLVLTPLDKNLSSGLLWKNIRKLEQQTNSFKQIHRQESLSPLIYNLISSAPIGIFSPERVVHAFLSNKISQDLVRPFVNMDTHQTRIVFHLSTQSDPDISDIMSRLEREAKPIFEGIADISFEGQTVLYEKQRELIMDAQLQSLYLALLLITIVMIIQLRSLTLGFISLIPNALPILTMFGLMGLLKIPLDPMMIFGVIISFGLSVDDSIHFLTQLKREISKDHGQSDMKHYLDKSYHITARALLSTTSVLFLSSQSFLFSSFEHISSLGILIASASAAALYGDLILMPALLIKCKTLQKLLLKNTGFA